MRCGLLIGLVATLVAGCERERGYDPDRARSATNQALEKLQEEYALEKAVGRAREKLE